MTSCFARKIVATSVAVALTSTASVFAIPASATLQGTVLAAGSSPLAGATVRATDDAGTMRASAVTDADGSFRIEGMTPGRQSLSIVSDGTAYDVATPVTLAPGQTKSVHVALRRSGDDDKKKKKGGAPYWTAGAKGAMIAVLVGFAAAGAVGISQAGNDSTQPSASPSNPND
ncbi:MAG TPA: carboxypeptidase-like regulatory domain-containing protein [Candidatus Polarisedimenticolaceae bacterium]|nr:carboxypeptidase-like regulatory domain-containing protein [Candidatus Polarisedimenticolaceae bacterium]